ncbi:MAG TPA: periplasmic heavy metal sensor [Candidatus Binatia bacterium]|nr:periplasmic heavy metal sensor [Candidatus Binatia bacterium]
MNRTVKLAFVASITLNVLLIGVLVGQSPRRFDRGAARQQRTEQAVKDLPEASQVRLRERLKQLRSAAEPLIEEMRKHQDEAVRLLGADPFDEAAYDRQVTKIAELRLNMTKNLSQVAKSASQDLSPLERQRFAAMLRRPPPKS